jgi:hypothetical protein
MVAGPFDEDDLLVQLSSLEVFSFGQEEFIVTGELIPLFESPLRFKVEKSPVC